MPLNDPLVGYYARRDKARKSRRWKIVFRSKGCGRGKRAKWVRR